MIAAAARSEMILWTPLGDGRPGPMADFLDLARAQTGFELPDYRSALAWSTQHLAEFWDLVRQHGEIVGDFEGPVLEGDRAPDARWYPRARLNYAENVLHLKRGVAETDIAILDVTEEGESRAVTWADLIARVASFAESLRRVGVGRGDRVAAIMPNTAETIIALLGCASIGAIWSICSPELSETAVLGRLAQLEPRVLIGTSGYRYNGKWRDCRAHVAAVAVRLPSVTTVVHVGDPILPDSVAFSELTELSVRPVYEQVGFEDPLWVLFTSGTTGAPKGIVHGHGGMVLEGVKSARLHLELGPDDTYLVAANTSWMVWNTILAGLLTGATVLTYSGSPQFPDVDRQFQLIEQYGVTAFGIGAAYLALVHARRARSAAQYDLSRLRVVSSTGSPLPDAVSLWLHATVPPECRLSDASGGTEICSAYVGGNPLEPVRLGWMQGALLGVGIEVYDDAGEPLRGRLGDLVITRPHPAMPVALWGDDGTRYRDTYFSRFPGVWTQGDWMTLNRDGTCRVHGRSDATINRGGVRLGSAEIYGALAGVTSVRDAVVFGVEEPDGQYYLPLFVALADGAVWGDDLEAELLEAIRCRASARHLPDEIIVVPDIPVTHSGKRVEVAIKRLFSGAVPSSIDRSTLANPASIDWFVQRAAAYRARQQ